MPYKDKEEQKAYSKAWYEANKERKAASNKAYREDNKEKIAENYKAYYEANKEKVAARNKAHYKANKEKLAEYYRTYKQDNKEKIAASNKAYREDNKEKIASLGARRRALKRKQIPVHLRDCPHEKQRLLQIYKLSKLLREVTGVEHHVDHMWPLADGGPHWSGNLQVIPAEKNLSKSASVCEDTKATIIKSLYSFDTTASI